MPTQATIWLTIGGILLFVILEDPKVFQWLVLVSKITNLWVAQRWFIIRNHPNTPWVQYQIKRNADKIAKQLIEETNAGK